MSPMDLPYIYNTGAGGPSQGVCPTGRSGQPQGKPPSPVAVGVRRSSPWGGSIDRPQRWPRDRPERSPVATPGPARVRPSEAASAFFAGYCTDTLLDGYCGLDSLLFHIPPELLSTTWHNTRSPLL